MRRGLLAAAALAGMVILTQAAGGGTKPGNSIDLATDFRDPRLDFISSLCKVLGDTGSIVVYNQQFEEARLVELAASLPEFAQRIKGIQARLWDLLPTVRNHV